MTTEIGGRAMREVVGAADDDSDVNPLPAAAGAALAAAAVGAALAAAAAGAALAVAAAGVARFG